MRHDALPGIPADVEIPAPTSSKILLLCSIKVAALSIDFCRTASGSKGLSTSSGGSSVRFRLPLRPDIDRKRLG